ncbi:MAG TPA: PAS domain-containing sensor histidine kinase [Xanthobacteraceae bacterium]|jgi:two-component system nitrogen regulation sensor histidine kinase NtrY
MTTLQDAALTDATATASTGGRRVISIIGPIAVCLALLSALATFLVLVGFTPIAADHYVVVGLLGVNALAVLVLLGVIVREIWPVMQARRRGRAGARLHTRIVGLFSVIAAVPAILVAIVASITLDRGLDQLLSARDLISNTLVVAEIYVREQIGVLRGDTIAMAITMTQAKPLFDQDQDRFRQFFTAQASLRGMRDAMLIRADRSIIVKSGASKQTQVLLPPTAMLNKVSDTEAHVEPVPQTNLMIALIKVRGYEDTYLYGVRPIDPRVVELGTKASAMLESYDELKARRLGVQIAFALMYTVIALTVLLSAVWIGLNFANLLVAPIRRLIGAANIVSTGNLYVQVPVRSSEGDLGQLGETFNKMTQELRTQRDDIVRARDLIDSRRRFIEAVLAGASAGVIGADAEGKISILNRSAERLIGTSAEEAIGRKVTEVAPELAELVASALAGSQRLVHGQVTISRAGGERIISVRVATEQTADPQHGYVVTLDEITELVVAQRTSAWADVARRIAHEIKNPLTPIQLSAERLRRKYGKTITEDRAIFEQCTDTIVRQVDDIRRMVDEFSRFARMPKPVMTADDAADTVRQVVFLMRVGHTDIDIDTEFAQDSMPAKFDRRLISQALTNIIKNATEAVSAVPPAELGRGHIQVSAAREGEDIVIDVVDNGIGLPKENRSRLLEPYVTTREKGTGLGLAIVGKILEDHGGRIELRDAGDKTPGARGAWMRLRFAAEAVAPANDEPSASAPPPTTAASK